MQSLLALVPLLGTSWKQIARILNDQFPGHGRTGDNVKDKWKQLGAQNAAGRVEGQWQLQEVIKLINIIEKAMSTVILNPKIKITTKAKIKIKVKGHYCNGST